METSEHPLHVAAGLAVGDVFHPLIIFAGRTSASIASYNAGPEAVAKWHPESAEEDDEWVEDIPYSQTRSYVKRVLRSLHAYQVLY